MMWYAVNRHSICTPLISYFLLEGVNYICCFRKVRFHKFFTDEVLMGVKAASANKRLGSSVKGS